MPVSYATTICGVLLYIDTPLCVVGMVRTGWGWGPEFGFLFPLAISYHIVRKHGGDIEVESEPGRGTTFAVELPAGTAVSAIQQPMRRS